jgi:hypothetical protein
MMTLRDLTMMTRWKNKLKPTIASQVGRQCADESSIDTYGLPIVTYQCSVYISCQSADKSSFFPWEQFTARGAHKRSTAKFSQPNTFTGLMHNTR